MSGYDIDSISAEEIVGNVDRINHELFNATPSAILKWVLKAYGKDAFLAFSGAEDVVLIDLAVRVLKKMDHLNSVPVVTLDTGRLHPETYQYLEEVRDYYGDSIAFEVLYPDTEQVIKLVKEKGLYSFCQDGHAECCSIRKTLPLRKRLQGVSSWITGVRLDQSEYRKDFPVVSIDTAFSTEKHSIVKVNPILHWNLEQVWNYIALHQLPYNELHDRGYTSIGCEPCTRPTLPHEDPRAGRWWYEEDATKECGLHHHGFHHERYHPFSKK